MRTITQSIGAALALGAMASTTSAQPADPDRLLQRLRDLEAEVERLSGSTLAERRAEEMRIVVEDVLADSQTRMSLLDDGVLAGWDDGDFVLRDPDGNYELDVSGHIQTRWAWSRRNTSTGHAEDRGFEMRRVKLKFDGHIVDPRIRYSVKFAFYRETGAALLQDATVEYRDDGWTVRAGRFRSPLLREEHVSSKRQIGVERSLVALGFRQLRTTGIGATYQGDTFRVHAAAMDASEPSSALDAWQVSCRGEVLFRGDWRELRDMTSFRGDETTVAAGAGILHRRAEALPVDTELTRWTIDGAVELGGAHVFVAFVGNHTDDGVMPRDQFGALVQGSLFITDELEGFVQYQWGDADGLAPDMNVATAGFNWYVHEHDLKITVDAGYAFDEMAGFWATDSGAWETDEAMEEGQVVVRAQLQLVF